MNAAVSLQQRIAIQTMQAVENMDRAKGVTAETVAEFHHLLGNIFLQAALCAQIGNEFLEGAGTDELAEKMLLELGNIKSNLVFIGSIINGKSK
jgi:hypothetical protein